MLAPILYTLAGAAIGAGVAAGIFLLGFCFEFLTCFCMILTCDFSSDVPEIIEPSSMGFLFVSCIIGGAVIGCIWGFSKMMTEINDKNNQKKAEDAEALKKQQEAWAINVKAMASKLSNNCKDNLAHYQPLVSTEDRRAVTSTNLKSDNTMKDIMAEFAKISEVEGEMTAITDYLNEKER